jgi:hypothetical protein
MCQFSFSFSGSSEALTGRARHAIEDGGGTFAGDVSGGNFKARTGIGSIQGSYEIAGQQIILTITKKPLLLTCSRIEKELTSMLR